MLTILLPEVRVGYVDHYNIIICKTTASTNSSFWLVLAPNVLGNLATLGLAELGQTFGRRCQSYAIKSLNAKRESYIHNLKVNT